jgi:hypothetical protein
MWRASGAVVFCQALSLMTMLASWQTTPTHLQSSVTGKAIMDNPGASCRTEDLMLFRRIFDECLRSLPVDKRTAIHQARLAKQLLDCAATGERNQIEYRLSAMADAKARLDRTRSP